MRLPDDVRLLPIHERLEAILDALCREGRLGLTAEAGAGKSTLVPLAMLQDARFSGGRILHVLPRRLAVLAVAERVARLRGEAPGDVVGYRTREATRVSARTRLEVVTLGVALRMIQADPTLDGIGCVILDEFHERHWQGDLIWAFVQQVRAEIRPDLRLLLCTTDLPPELDIPRLAVPGRQFPVEIAHRAPPPGERLEESVARTALDLLPSMGGGECLLAFVPGWGEIARCVHELRMRLPADVECIGLSRASQTAVREQVFSPVPPAGRRVVVATNIAETSLTLPGVTAVVDSGLERRFVFSPRTGLVHASTVPISQVSAVQRAGRAGRLRPGRAVRLWPASRELAPFARPEILEADPLPLELELALWGPGAEPYLLTPPPSAARALAAGRLRDLGLLDEGGRVTPRGRDAASLGVHPRLGALLLHAREDARPGAALPATACLLAALLEEDAWRPAQDPDLVSAWIAGLLAGGFSRLPERIRTAVSRLAGAAGIRFSPERVDPDLCAGLLCRAYPDRVGRVDASGMRAVLVSGRAARIVPQPPGTLVVAPFVEGGEATGRILLFEPCTLEDVLAAGARACETRVTVEFDGWRVRGRIRRMLGQMTLEERTAAPDDESLRAAVRERLAGLAPEEWLGGPQTRALRLRIRLASRADGRNWPDVEEVALAAAVDEWLLPHVRYREGDVLDDALVARALWESLDGRQKAAVQKHAPEIWVLPSGRRVRVDYDDGIRPRLASKLQDFFGCRATPRIGGEPVVVELLSPAGRPVQVTSDLEGFWKNSYPLVRKEMAGRYPRHPWPVDP